MKLRRILALLIVLTIITPLYGSFVVASDYDAYLYSFDGKYKKSTPMYSPEKTIDLSDIMESPVSRPNDLFCDIEGNIYICDSGKNRIIILDSGYKLKKVIEEIVNTSDNSKVKFNAPLGIFVDKKLNLYIADTENGRIVVLDRDQNLKDIFTPQKGDSIPEEFSFKPVSLVTDESGRMFVVSRASNLGIVSLNANGEFEGFLGAQIATPTASELFWRLFMTKAQIERTAKIIPVEYSNISIDNEGFVFVTSSALDKNLQYNALITRSKDSDYAPVKRLNPEGNDVLRRAGFYPPAGDIDIPVNTIAQKAVSAFGDVAIDSIGVYSILDINQNRLFTYDPNGNLLNIFGGSGISQGKFSKASSICYSKDKLLLLDESTGRITEFDRTGFGKQVYEALRLQEERKYKEALLTWEDIAKSNSNLDFVYINMGKSYMQQEQYSKAMEYFKLVNDKTNYSKAFKYYRNDAVKKVFIFIPVILLLAVFLIMKMSKKLKEINKKDSITSNLVVTVKKELIFSFHTLFHPLDGFYDAKRYGRAGVRGALIIFILAVATIVARTLLCSFAFSSDNIKENNIITGIVKIVLPVMVFCIANWCASSFMYGEGRFKDIFVTVSYSLLPLVLLLVPITVMTHFLTLEEGQILFLFESIAYLWVVFLLFFGTLTIHGYTLGKNILSSLFSVLGMIVIIFLMILFIALFQKCYVFLENIFTEILFRI